MSSPRIELYGPEAIDRIPWPDGADSPEAYWLQAFLRDGVERYIGNVCTQFFILQLEHWCFPVTVNDTEYDNAYVTSPYTHYVRYARQELKYLKTPPLEAPLHLLLSGMGVLLKTGRINRTVHVNNWLLSTNLYPDWQGAHLEGVTNFLANRFPGHAIVFRSLNEYRDKIHLEQFRQQGYQPILSRQVYWLDGQSSGWEKRRDLKKDRTLLRQTAYRVETHESLTETDIPRMLALYNALYLDKYSPDNPHFTEAFFRLCLEKRLLTFWGLRNSEGQLDGVIGYFVRDGAMTTPVVGYDTSLPREAGLYRMLTSLMLDAAKAQGLMFNMSSGAAGFKRLRGAIGALEFSAVYTRHLPWHRCLPWTLIWLIANRLAQPIMIAWKL